MSKKKAIHERLKEKGYPKIIEGPIDIRAYGITPEYVDLLQQRIAELEVEQREAIEDLYDRLNNGIKYDSYRNEYRVVWTKRELDKARKEAAEIYRRLSDD